MTKKIKIIFLVLCCCFLKRATAQNWDSLTSGIPYGGNIYCMYGDSADNYLYVGGTFNSAGGLPIIGLARWNDTIFSSMGYTGYVRSMTRYHDTLYASGNFQPTIKRYVGKWNGTSWDTIGQLHGYGDVFNYAEFGNDLYVVGAFDSIAHTHANNIAKWDGTNWSSLKDTTFNAGIYAVAVYKNELYIGGTFYNTSTGVHGIAKWNGTNFVRLSNGGIYGGMDDIVDMVVYKNELYVSGTFSKADGNVGNYIQKWNDTTWSEVGGGVTGLSGANGQIQDMKIDGNYLYVVGDFQIAGGISANYVARWDGTNWCSFGSSVDNILVATAFKNGDMYVAGPFQKIDGDSISEIAKWIGGPYIDTCGHLTTGINEVQINNETLNIYPNPATNQITIEFESLLQQNYLMEIRNILGQIVYSETMKNVSGKQAKNIDLSMIESGVYFVRLQGEKESISKKFIKD